MTTARHPNRTGLRTTAATASLDPAGQVGDTTEVLACRCPARTVSGAVWAYDSRLGWHDPAEHGTWTPPRQPPHAPLPAALRDWTALSGRRGRTSQPPATVRRHTLAPAGTGLVVCTACGLCFDAGACTRSGRPLPACQPPAAGEVSATRPTVLSDAQEDQ